MTAPTTWALRAKGLTHSFSRGWLRPRSYALRGLDLELQFGQVLGLVGPNGSGKSTLLRLLAGIEAHAEGCVEVLGGSPLSQAVRARVGYAAEESHFPPELRARDALDMLGALKGMQRARCRARAQSLLEQIGLAHNARERLGSFSRGMLRRFALAQALLSEPDLLLLDEPTAGLDALGQPAFEALLDQTQRRGASVVLCSHQVSDLVGRCDQIAVLCAGKKIAGGARDDFWIEWASSWEVEIQAELREKRGSQVARVCTGLEALGIKVLGTRPSQRAMASMFRRCASELPDPAKSAPDDSTSTPGAKA